jgi:uncharacterized protein YydD (DUF2326 family)
MSVDKAIEGATSFAKNNGPWAMLSVCLVAAVTWASWTLMTAHNAATMKNTDYLIDEIKTGQEDLKEINAYTRDRLEKVVDGNTQAITEFKGALDKNSSALDELEKTIRERTGLEEDGR